MLPYLSASNILDLNFSEHPQKSVVQRISHLYYPGESEAESQLNLIPTTKHKESKMLYYSLNSSVDETVLNFRIAEFLASGRQRMTFSDGWTLYLDCYNEVCGFIHSEITGNTSLQIGRRGH